MKIICKKVGFLDSEQLMRKSDLKSDLIMKNDQIIKSDPQSDQIMICNLAEKWSPITSWSDLWSWSDLSNLCQNGKWWKIVPKLRSCAQKKTSSVLKCAILFLLSYLDSKSWLIWHNFGPNIRNTFGPSNTSAVILMSYLLFSILDWTLWSLHR